MHSYCNYDIIDAISGLEAFRSLIGYCDLANYIDIAISCMNDTIERASKGNDE